MFLSRRAVQEEYFDAERPLAEIRNFFDELNSMNRMFRVHQPFTTVLASLLARQNLTRLSILDIGSGDGYLANTLAEWSGRQGWTWECISLDASPLNLTLGQCGSKVAGSATALPFADDAVDVVIASQMTHHLEEKQARDHLREAWRVARRAVVICDLQRSPCMYAFLWAFLRLRGFSKHFREDALLSVRRAWRVPELKRLATEAGWTEPRVRGYFGARTVLYGTKTPRQPVA